LYEGLLPTICIYCIVLKKCYITVTVFCACLRKYPTVMALAVLYRIAFK